MGGLNDVLILLGTICVGPFVRRQVQIEILSKLFMVNLSKSGDACDQDAGPSQTQKTASEAEGNLGAIRDHFGSFEAVPKKLRTSLIL